MSNSVAQILRENKKKIAQDWVSIILSIPDSKYKERPVSELLASTEEGVMASIEIFENRGTRRFEDFLYNVSLTRLQMGFEIAEVSEALMALREAMLPFILEKLREHPEQLMAVFSEIDRQTRWTISKFSSIFSKGLNRRLETNLQELHEHESRLHQQKSQLQRSLKEVNSLMDSVRTIASTLDLDTVLNYIVEQACDLMGTPNCVIFEVEEISKKLSLRSSKGPLTKIEKSEIDTLLTEEEIMKQVTQVQKTLQLADISSDPLINATPLQKALLNQHIHALIAAPLISQDEILGGIAVLYDSPHQFNDEDKNLLTTFSLHAAIAIKNARLYERSRQAAILEERNRLAREIHDNLAQGLTAIILQLEVVDRLVTKKPELIKTELENIKQQARKNLQEARRSVWDLRAGASLLLALHERMTKEIEKLKITSNIKLAFKLSGTPVKIAHEATNHIYRVFQESLNNIFQHSQASQVLIELIYENENVILKVTDDGIGAESLKSKKSDAKKGFGLMGMQERARILKGNFDIGSSDGKGTTVILTVPLATWLDDSFAQASDE